MLILFKFNYISYKIKKSDCLDRINEIYLCVHTNLIIYIIVTDFLII